MTGEPTLPADPLVEAVTARGGVGVVARGLASRGGLEKAYRRARAAGRLTVWAADQLAIRLLGEHPLAVWGDDWWQAEPADARDRVLEQPPADERRTSCRPGWRPCRRRHVHASPRRAG